jgi:copper chaperone CopZ
LNATLDQIPAGHGRPGRPHDRCRTMNRISKQKGSQMNRSLSWIACAAMLLVASSVSVRAEDVAPPAPAADQPARITLAIGTIGSAADADKVTTALKGVKGVTDVTGLTADSKRATVTYTPGQVSVQQIAQAVADVPGAASNPFRAELVIHVENLSDTANQDKAKEAVKKVAGISDATVADAAAGNLDVQFAPMEAGDKSGAVKGATQEQILKALKDAGLTATTDILPAATAK